MIYISVYRCCRIVVLFMFVVQWGRETLLLLGGCGDVSGYHCERNTFVCSRLVKLGAVFHVEYRPFFFSSMSNLINIYVL